MNNLHWIETVIFIAMFVWQFRDFLHFFKGYGYKKPSLAPGANFYPQLVKTKEPKRRIWLLLQTVFLMALSLWLLS